MAEINKQKTMDYLKIDEPTYTEYYDILNNNGVNPSASAMRKLKELLTGRDLKGNNIDEIYGLNERSTGEQVQGVLTEDNYMIYARHQSFYSMLADIGFATKERNVIDKIKNPMGMTVYKLKTDIIPEKYKNIIYNTVSKVDTQTSLGKNARGMERITSELITFGNTAEESRDIGEKYQNILGSFPADMLTTDKNVDISSVVLDKIKEGLSGADINAIINDLYTTGESPYVDETEYQKPVDEEAVEEEEAKKKEYDDKILNMIDEMGIPFDDETKQEAIEYFSELLQDGSLAEFQIRQLLQQMPEYQTKLQEEERVAIGKETGELQEELGEQLTREGEQFLQEKALPDIERQYARLGGEERVSTDVAKAKAIRDVAQSRESALTESGLRADVTQEGYQREDYLLNASANYSMALNNWNNMNQNLANEREMFRQRYWQPLSTAEQTYANERANRQQKESQQWQESLAKTTRSWQQQDMKSLMDVQKQQNWANLLGYGAGVAIGTYGPNLFNKQSPQNNNINTNFRNTNLDVSGYNQFWR